MVRTKSTSNPEAKVVRLIKEGKVRKAGHGINQNVLTSPINPDRKVSGKRYKKEANCKEKGQIYRKAGGNRPVGGCVGKPSTARKTRADLGIPRNPQDPARIAYLAEKALKKKKDGFGRS